MLTGTLLMPILTYKYYVTNSILKSFRYTGFGSFQQI
jgi:hypothetical protein